MVPKCAAGVMGLLGLSQPEDAVTPSTRPSTEVRRSPGPTRLSCGAGSRLGHGLQPLRKRGQHRWLGLCGELEDIETQVADDRFVGCFPIIPITTGKALQVSL